MSDSSCARQRARSSIFMFLFYRRGPVKISKFDISARFLFRWFLILDEVLYNSTCVRMLTFIGVATRSHTSFYCEWNYFNDSFTTSWTWTWCFGTTIFLFLMTLIPWAFMDSAWGSTVRVPDLHPPPPFSALPKWHMPRTSTSSGPVACPVIVTLISSFRLRLFPLSCSQTRP